MSSVPPSDDETVYSSQLSVEEEAFSQVLRVSRMGKRLRSLNSQSRKNAKKIADENKIIKKNKNNQDDVASTSIHGASQLAGPSTSVNPPNPGAQVPVFTTPNPFATLPIEEMDTQLASQSRPVAKVPKPPAIYIRNVTNFSQLCVILTEKLGPELTFSCKSRVSDLAVYADTSDGYRAIITYLKESNADYHCYELKEDKAYRVAIRHLHHTTPVQDIKNELQAKGFTVRHVHNVLQRHTKLPLPLFFVELEPSPNNSDIFLLKTLAYCSIKVEEPHKNKELPQCTRCQGLLHTKNYCRHPPRCVKCAGSHLTQDCVQPTQSVKCANCNGEHTANYRGCSVYKDLQNIVRKKKSHPKFPNNNRTTVTSPQRAAQDNSTSAQPPTYNHVASHFPSLNTQQLHTTSSYTRGSTSQVPNYPSYASAVSSSHVVNSNPVQPSYIPPPPTATDITPLLSSFSSKLEALILPLVSAINALVSLLPSLSK